MALRTTLAQSILSLERIGGRDSDSFRRRSEESPPPLYRRRSASTASLATTLPRHSFTWDFEERYYDKRFSRVTQRRPLGEKHLYMKPESMDSGNKMEDDDPKVTISGLLRRLRDVLPVVLAFIVPAIGAVIIGLSVDNIEWYKFRGDTEFLTDTVAVFYRKVEGVYLQWRSYMIQTPWKYETNEFWAMVVLGIIAILGGILIAVLSMMHYNSISRSIKLGRKTKHYEKFVLHTLVGLDALILSLTIIAIGYIHELFKFDRHTNQSEYYGLNATYLRPSLEGPGIEPPYAKPDGIVRDYISPIHYNPLSWNCMMAGYVSTPIQHRYFQLCQEGVSARNLTVVMLFIQMIILAAHSYDLWTIRSKDKVLEIETESDE